MICDSSGFAFDLDLGATELLEELVDCPCPESLTADAVVGLPTGARSGDSEGDFFPFFFVTPIFN